MTTTYRDRFDLDFSDIHEPILPTDIRDTDPALVVARIRRRFNDSFTPIRVWKLSPLGIELVFDQDNPFSKGEKIDLEITLAGQRSLFEGLVVDLVQQNEEIKLLGIRLSNKKSSSSPESEKRKSVRWICSEDYSDMRLTNSWQIQRIHILPDKRHLKGRISADMQLEKQVPHPWNSTKSCLRRAFR